MKKAIHLAAFVLAYLFVAAITVKAEPSLLNASSNASRVPGEGNAHAADGRAYDKVALAGRK